jgi:hypothetical protein
MGNVSIVVLLFFLIFAILGVQLFSGKFYRCNDVTVSHPAALTRGVLAAGAKRRRRKLAPALSELQRCSAALPGC